MKLVLIRGPPAVGKTTVTKGVLLELKTKHKIDCAYISEDDFRKQMQFKYKAADSEVYKNSVKIIEQVIKKLLKLDNYDIIFIEGLFRYEFSIKDYEKLAKRNKFEMIMFQFEASLKELFKRDSKLRETKTTFKEIKEIKRDIDKYVPEYAIKVDSTKPIKHQLEKIISSIK